MQTNGITNQTNGSEAKTGAAVAGDAFLTILVAQMRSQNPLEPMNPNEFVAQLVQFNSLEQLIQIREILEQSPAAPKE